MKRLAQLRIVSGTLPLGAMLAGIMMAQGLAPVGLWGATLLGLVVAGYLFLLSAPSGINMRRPWRRAALFGWCLGFGYFCWGLRWIVEPFQVDVKSHGWMAPFALIFLSGGLALFWGAAFGCARVVSRRGGLWVLVGAWSLGELARGYVLTGFPWAGLGQAVPRDPFWAVLPWIGAHGLGLVLLAATVPLAAAIRAQGWRRAVVFAPAVVLTVSLVVLGRGVPAPEHVEFTDETVRLVQPNAPQNEKWLPEKRWVFFERLLALTAADGEVDLTVWPETAVPSLLNYADEFVQPMVQVSGGGAILYGVQREDAGQYHNSAVLMGAEGQSLDIYDKMHLVPFGEYMPLSDLAARFGVFGLAARAQSGYAPGAERRLLDLPVGRALVLICYEGVFGQDVRDFEDRADLMVLITNDAWFGLAAGPQQHLVQAQMRAAEQGLPMVRVANTGISAMIDPWGRLRVQLPLNEAGFVDAALPAPLPETFYARTGDWYVSLLSCFCVVCGSLSGLRRRNRRGILTD